MKIDIREVLRDLLVAGGILAAMLLAAGCGPSDANQKPLENTARPVKAVQLSADSGTRELQLPGAARALRDSSLSFRVGGPLIDLRVDIGTSVQKGQVVARIDPRDFQIRVNTSRARLNSAKAQLAEAELQFKRYAKLIKHKAVAQAEYDRVKAAYEVALAQEESSAKALEDAKNALADTVLKAPFAGFINERLVDNHETLQPGQPVASLVDLSRMEVKLALSEDLLPLVPKFASFTCAFDALPGRVFQAELKEVGKKADPASRTYPLILTLEQSASPVVRPGMSAEVSVSLARSPAGGGFVVPLTALVNRGGQQAFVWLVNAETGGLKRTPVTVLRLLGEGAEISGGLSAGQWIVIAGANSLQDGQTVRLMNQPSKTNIGLEM